MNLLRSPTALWEGVGSGRPALGPRAMISSGLLMEAFSVALRFNPYGGIAPSAPQS
jgi:hypothetical protein